MAGRLGTRTGDDRSPKGQDYSWKVGEATAMWTRIVLASGLAGNVVYDKATLWAEYHNAANEPKANRQQPQH